MLSPINMRIKKVQHLLPQPSQKVTNSVPRDHPSSGTNSVSDCDFSSQSCGGWIHRIFGSRPSGRVESETSRASKIQKKYTHTPNKMQLVSAVHNHSFWRSLQTSKSWSQKPFATPTPLSKLAVPCVGPARLGIHRNGSWSCLIPGNPNQPKPKII